MDRHRIGPSTLAVHAGHEADESGSLDAPIVMSSAFAFDDADDARARFRGERDGFIYNRWGSPTVTALERAVAELEGAEASVALASGMAAVTAVIGALADPGDRVIVPQIVYAETTRAVSGPFARFGIEAVKVDLSRDGALSDGVPERTKLVWIETPANPTVAISDVAAIAERAHRAGALVVVDGTFATPYHQRALALGADLALHSATKALGGHGDALGGVVSGSRDLVARVRYHGVRVMGAVMSPFVAWAIMRGLRTLALRAARASASAMELATRLEAHAAVERVHYPGLASHPGHAVASRQMERGFGAMLAFELRGGLPAGRTVYDSVELITRAVSLGDVRTLVTHAASTTHASVSEEARRAAGITDGLLRLSVGIEDAEDLWRDLERALARAT